MNAPKKWTISQTVGIHFQSQYPMWSKLLFAFYDGYQQSCEAESWVHRETF